MVWLALAEIKSELPNHSEIYYLGGYDMLGRTKDQITSKEQVNSALNACQTLDLNGLVVIGGICLDFNPK